MAIMRGEIKMRVLRVPREPSMHGPAGVTDGHVFENVVDAEIEDRDSNQRNDRPRYEHRSEYDQRDPGCAVEILLHIHFLTLTRATILHDVRLRKGNRRLGSARAAGVRGGPLRSQPE